MREEGMATQHPATPDIYWPGSANKSSHRPEFIYNSELYTLISFFNVNFYKFLLIGNNIKIKIKLLYISAYLIFLRRLLRCISSSH
jgi:hypothetical protein